MLAALATNSVNKSDLHKVVALSPCVMLNVEGKDESYYENGLYKFPKFGVRSIVGPTWEVFDKKRICESFS